MLLRMAVEAELAPVRLCWEVVEEMEYREVEEEMVCQGAMVQMELPWVEEEEEP